MLAVLAVTVAGLLVFIGSAFICYRMEWKGLAVCAVPAVALLAYAGASADIPLLSAPFVMGCVGGFTFRMGKSFGFYLVTSSVILAVIFAAFFYYILWFRGIDIIALIRVELERMLGAAGAPADISAQFLADFDASREDIIARVPFSAFLNGVAFSGIGFVILRRFFARFADTGPVAGLEMFRMNDHFIFALIAGLAVYLLIDKTASPAIHSAGFNLVMAASLLYFVQALGVAKFMLIRRDMPRFMLPLAVVALAVAGLGAMVFMFVILAGAGALDVWADFRKIGNRGGDEHPG